MAVSAKPAMLPKETAEALASPVAFAAGQTLFSSHDQRHGGHRQQLTEGSTSVPRLERKKKNSLLSSHSSNCRAAYAVRAGGG